jgi:hypothetical protein
MGKKCFVRKGIREGWQVSADIERKASEERREQTGD